ncbi:MAG: DUF4256 domain-containing protein [Bacteroidota bacterium]
MATTKKELTTEQRQELLGILRNRFEKNNNRHTGIHWDDVQAKLESHPAALWSLNAMEETGGEPDVVGKEKDHLIFMDCSPESPKGRRSICYDQQALDGRKENKPAHSAVAMAEQMGIELLNEEQYRGLQELGKFDEKTSSWIATPASIRKLKGALFCDRRYETVFVYHNGAESYYAGRGFRGMLKV